MCYVEWYEVIGVGSGRITVAELFQLAYDATSFSCRLENGDPYDPSNITAIKMGLPLFFQQAGEWQAKQDCEPSLQVICTESWNPWFLE